MTLALLASQDAYQFSYCNNHHASDGQSRHDALSKNKTLENAPRSAEMSPCSLFEKRTHQACAGPWESVDDIDPLMLTYIDKVYGVDSLNFPLSLRRSTFFWDDVPWRESARVHKFVQDIPLGSLYHGGFHHKNSMLFVHTYGNGSYNKPDRSSSPMCGYMLENYLEYIDGVHMEQHVFSNHMRIEVTHMCCDDAVDAPGTWFFYAPGSGVYYDVGFTAAFANKICACEYFKRLRQSSLEFDCFISGQHVHEFLLLWAKAFKYDSLIFYDSYPGGLHGWPSCIEVWDIRDLRPQSKNNGACPYVNEHNTSSCSTCLSNHLYAGHKGAYPCECDRTSTTLRCHLRRKSFSDPLERRLPLPEGDKAMGNVLEDWERRPLNVTLMLTADMHGFIDTIPEILKKINDLKQRQSIVMLVSAGDAFVGSAFFRKYGPLELGHVLKQLSYDVMGLGNHDLEYVNDLKAFAENSHTQIVCFNLNGLTGVQNWISMLKGGAQICVSGFTVLDMNVLNETQYSYTPPGSDSFWSTMDSVMQAMQESKCELRIILGHGGFKLDRVISNRYAGVVVLGGHSHITYFESDYKNLEHVVMHAGHDMLEAGILELVVNNSNIMSAHGSMLQLSPPRPRDMYDEPTLFELLLKSNTRNMQSYFHSQSCRCGRCPLGDLVSELMFLAAFCNESSFKPIGNHDSTLLYGAIREVGSLRNRLRRNVTSSALRDVLAWNNDLILLKVSRLKLQQLLSKAADLDGNSGARLATYGFRLSAHGEVEVLDNFRLVERCKRFQDDRNQNKIRLRLEEYASTERSPYRSLKQNEEFIVVATKWLSGGGDGYGKIEPWFTLGQEVPLIEHLFLKDSHIQNSTIAQLVDNRASTHRYHGILQAIIGALFAASSKMMCVAIVYGFSQQNTRQIASRGLRSSTTFESCAAMCQPANSEDNRGRCLMVTAVGIGQFIYWGIFRIGITMFDGARYTFLLSLVASVFVVVVENPLWVIITRVQGAESVGIKNHKLIDTFDMSNGEYVLARRMCLQILVEEGTQGFCAGLWMNLFLVVHPIISTNIYLLIVHFAAENIFQCTINEALQSIWWLSVVAGSMSMVITMFLTYPAQVLRIRVQLKQEPFSGRYFDGFLVKMQQSVLSASLAFFFMDYVSVLFTTGLSQIVESFIAAFSIAFFE